MNDPRRGRRRPPIARAVADHAGDVFERRARFGDRMIPRSSPSLAKRPPTILAGSHRSREWMPRHQASVPEGCWAGRRSSLDHLRYRPTELFRILKGSTHRGAKRVVGCASTTALLQRQSRHEVRDRSTDDFGVMDLVAPQEFLAEPDQKGSALIVAPIDGNGGSRPLRKFTILYSSPLANGEIIAQACARARQEIWVIGRTIAFNAFSASASPEDSAVEARALDPDLPRRIISKRGRYYVEEIRYVPFNTKRPPTAKT